MKSTTCVPKEKNMRDTVNSRCSSSRNNYLIQCCQWSEEKNKGEHTEKEVNLEQTKFCISISETDMKTRE